MIFKNYSIKKKILNVIFVFLGLLNYNLELNSKLSTIESNLVAERLLYFFNILNFPEILDNNFYKETNKINQRNILTFPFNLEHFRIYNFEKNNFNLNFFYNKTSKKNFISEEKSNINSIFKIDEIGSYIALENESFISAIDQGSKSILNFFGDTSFNPADFLKLFGFAFLEERILGSVLTYCKKNNNFLFEIKIPLLWIERNFNFDEKKKNEIKEKIDNSSIFSSKNNNFDLNSFSKEYLIMDRLGLGNLELVFSYNFISKIKWGASCGFSTKLPTEMELSRNLYGSNYKEIDFQRPIFNFLDIVSLDEVELLNISDDSSNKINDYLLKVLKNFSSYLLECDFGNKNHLAIALFLKTYWNINEKFRLESSYYLEYLFPKFENRFFLNKNENSFSEQYINLINSNLENNYNIAVDSIQNAFAEKLFPTVLNLNINPGFIFLSNSTLKFKFLKMNVAIGYNYFYKTKEYFSFNNEKIYENLDIEKSLNSSISQTKIFLNLYSKEIICQNLNYYISLFLDKTIFNCGIGYDYSLGLNLKFLF